MDTEQNQTDLAAQRAALLYDRGDLDRIMFGLRQLYPTRSLTDDADGYMVAHYRGELRQVADELTAEDLHAIVNLARLLQAYPDARDEAMNYLAEQNRLIGTRYGLTAD